jgi:hypothetical protein
MADTKNMKYQKPADRSKKHDNLFITTDANLGKKIKFRKKIECYWNKRDKLRETFYIKTKRRII